MKKVYFGLIVLGFLFCINKIPSQDSMFLANCILESSKDGGESWTTRTNFIFASFIRNSTEIYRVRITPYP